MKAIEQQFLKLVQEQLARVERIKANSEVTDYSTKKQIIIGYCAGDGIGPIIMNVTINILNKLLANEIQSGKIVLKEIEGLTIENRLANNISIPENVLAEIKSCDVLLKGPTTTPSGGSEKNIESANVALRRELDLYANVRPIALPLEGIDWMFFRENTEGAYILGSQGIDISNDLSLDFRVITTPGTKRIAQAAFKYAKENGKKRVSIITKSNILKKTDGRFLATCLDVAKDYPDIKVDEYFIDIMTAKLLDESERSKFEVFILPNLYGDIITDEAAQIQGGIGTAGSANIGDKYAMFEAVHGSAPRLLELGLGEYANPSSLIKASEIMLRHIGLVEQANKLSTILENANDKIKVTGNKENSKCSDIEKYILNKL